MELRQAHLDLRKKQDEATALRRATRAVAQRGGGPPPPEASPPAQEEVLFDRKVSTCMSVACFCQQYSFVARWEAVEGTEEAHRSEETDGEDQDPHLPGIFRMWRLHGRGFVSLLQFVLLHVGWG